MLGLRSQRAVRPPATVPLKVFISYSRKEEVIADRIVGALVRRGIDVMIDRSDLAAGDDWKHELMKMIQAADTVVWLVSKHSIVSDVVKWELETIDNLNKRLIPVRIDETKPDQLPPAIKKLHLLSLLASDDFEMRLDDLVHTLKVPKIWVQTHTWLAEQARRDVRLRGQALRDAERWQECKPDLAEPPTQAIIDHITRSRRAADRGRYLTVASIAGGLASIAIAWKWYDDAQKIAQSRTLAVISEQATDRGNAGLGVNLALQALPDPDEGRGRPLIIEPQRALYKALFNLRERTVFAGHDKPLTYAEIDRSGERLLTSSSDGTAGLWTADGHLLQWLQGHKKAVNIARFSPDGSRIVTVSDDRTGILWGQSGERIATLAGHTQPVLFATFSHDGRQVATTSADYTARLWSAVDGKPLKVLRGHGAEVVAADFSPDDRLLATVSVDETGRLWSIVGDTEPVVLEGHQDRLRDVNFSPKGDMVATASRDRTVMLWTLDGRSTKRLQGHTGVVNTVRFDSKGSLIVTASDDNTSKIWTTAGEEIANLSGHGARVIHAEFDVDRSKVLTASVDGALGLWKVEMNAGATGDALEAHLLTMLRGHVRNVVAATFSADGQSVISAGNDRTARLWDAGDEPPFSKALRHECDVRSLAFSRDGKKFVTACKGGYVALWDAESLRRLQAAKANDVVISTALSTDGQRLALAHEDGTATIWDGEKLQQLGEVNGHGARVRSVAFSRDGTRLLTSSADGIAKIWNVRTQSEVLALVGHEDRVRSAVFSPDDQQVLTVSADRTAKVWDSRTGALLHSFEDHETDVWAADFSPDGTKIVTGSVDGEIFMNDLTRPEAKRSLIGHSDNIRSAEFSPDGRHILTSSWDRTVRLWDVEAAKAIATMPNEDIILDATFDPNGGRIAHLLKDRVRIRPIYPTAGALIEAAKSSRPHKSTSRDRQTRLSD